MIWTEGLGSIWSLNRMFIFTISFEPKILCLFEQFQVIFIDKCYAIQLAHRIEVNLCTGIVINLRAKTHYVASSQLQNTRSLIYVSLKEFFFSSVENLGFPHRISLLWEIDFWLSVPIRCSNKLWFNPKCLFLGLRLSSWEKRLFCQNFHGYYSRFQNKNLWWYYNIDQYFSY